MSRTFHYRWQWRLQSPPEALWPFIADTNRFNRDAGIPTVHRLDSDAPPLANARRKLSLKILGQTLTWDEEPFEWVWPKRHAVLRRYHTGPITELRAITELEPAPNGGTLLSATVQAIPRNFFGRLLIPFQIGRKHFRAVDRIYHQYDDLAQLGDPISSTDPSTIQFPPGATERLDRLIAQLNTQSADSNIPSHLATLLQSADELALIRMRPYSLADLWNLPRRSVLETFLSATRLGLLQFQWNILCPHCRGPASSHDSLANLDASAHCDTCNVTFDVNFERATELTFRPTPSIRHIEDREFCIGGPQVTPHVVAQKLLAPGQSFPFSPTLQPGGYRFRTLQQTGSISIRVNADLSSENSATPTLLISTDSGILDSSLTLPTSPTLQFENRSSTEQLFILERTAWTDQAATAADVITLQRFRDLFSSEALRPGQRISVGSLAILFTDLRASTALYRQIGDAPAFGHVMTHFDILKRAIAEQGGSLVKTIGDAVLAVFQHPGPAVQAARNAQIQLRDPRNLPTPLTLKAGIHFGPCIAVTLNERLDYFGATVNIAARLVDLSDGRDIILSNSVYADPVVQSLFQNPADSAANSPCPPCAPFSAQLKGYDEPFSLWRISNADHTQPDVHAQ